MASLATFSWTFHSEGGLSFSFSRFEGESAAVNRPLSDDSCESTFVGEVQADKRLVSRIASDADRLRAERYARRGPPSVLAVSKLEGVEVNTGSFLESLT